MTFPRNTVSSTRPLRTFPTCGEILCLCKTSFALSTNSSSGLKTTKSASFPTAIAPFWDKRHNSADPLLNSWDKLDKLTPRSTADVHNTDKPLKSNKTKGRIFLVGTELKRGYASPRRQKIRFSLHFRWAWRMVRNDWNNFTVFYWLPQVVLKKTSAVSFAI